MIDIVYVKSIFRILKRVLYSLCKKKGDSDPTGISEVGATLASLPLESSAGLGHLRLICQVGDKSATFVSPSDAILAHNFHRPLSPENGTVDLSSALS